VSLAGKDYLTIPDAAEYCGVSERQFRKKAPDMGLVPLEGMGKLIYRKTDLKHALERTAWQQSIGAATGLTLTGASTANGSAKALAASHRSKRNGRGRSRNSNSQPASG
jgi:hypothetical protein